MRCLKIIFSTSLFFIIVSCTSYRFLDIQVLKPAEISYPYPVDKLYIIDSRKIAINPKTGIDWKYYKIFIEGFNAELGKKLKESPSFENSEVILTKFPDMMQEYQKTDFSGRKKTSMCSLQSFALKDTIYKIYDFNSVFFRYELKYIMGINFYNLAQADDTRKDYVLEDTIYWTSSNVSFGEGVGNVKVNKDEMFQELSQYAAEAFANKIAPFWITEERVLYYRANKYMRMAYNSYTNNDLDNAISNWNFVYEKGAKYLASKAAHNLALCYESLDSLQLAEKWSNNSIALKSDPVSVDYNKTLKKRMSEKDILNSQLKQTKR